MKKYFAISLVVAIFAFTAMPFFAFAANSGVKSNVFDPTILGGPLLICTGAPGNGAVGNTCQNLCDFVAQIADIIYFAIAAVLWIVTPISVTIGGIMIMLAGPNHEMVSGGKKWITGAVWGVAIVLCAWVVIASFLAAFGNLGHYIGGFPGGPSACSL